ncbi:unnamed protein product [Mytilus coruscus]|uniref:Reverse transcriptase domain-containing protein n=1 Tax=Mytilus coruscus TaxID=42192 RepID=A0A6J8CRM9_MYTCO|nr:unnamed protein product [Mytilus coruscus]
MDNRRKPYPRQDRVWCKTTLRVALTSRGWTDVTKSIDLCRSFESTTKKLQTMAGSNGINESTDIKANIVKEYADIFDGEGSFQGHLHLEIDETITPVKSPLRRIPIAMKPKLKSELQRLKKRTEREIENLPGVRTVADDILIYGEGDAVEEATADHDIKLKAFLDRCRSRNIKLNRDKFQLRLTEMPYIGHLLTADGVKPGPEKIAAITQMDKPKDIKGSSTFTGNGKLSHEIYGKSKRFVRADQNLTHKRKCVELDR